MSIFANEKFYRNSCKKINNELVAAVDEIIEKVFVPKYRSINLILAFDNLYDCYMIDFKSELLKRNSKRVYSVRLLNHTDIPKISSRLRTMNIILLDNLKTFEKLYPKITPEVFDFRGYYLFVLLEGKTDFMSDIFSKMWNKWIYNVNAIYECSGTILISTFRPFDKDSCYEISPEIINQYVNGNFLNGNQSLDLYPNKFENLWKCEIRVVTLNRCPAVCERNKSKTIYGHDWDLIVELSKLLNFTIKLKFLKDSDKLQNLTSLVAVSILMKGEADILIGNYYLRTEYINKMDMSDSYDSIPMIFAIPNGKLYSPFEKLLQPFEIIVWILLICTFSIGILVIIIIEFKIKHVRSFVYGEKVNAPILNMIIAIFGSQQPILPKRNFARFILMMFLIFCLVQRNVYQGALYIFLQSDGRHKPMQTINEMIENDFVFYMHSRFIELVQDHKEIFIRKKIANNDNELPFSKPVDDNLHAAYLTTEDEIMYRNKKTHKQYVLKVCDERFTLIDIVMYYQKNFYLKKSIDQRISQLLSSGILHHWIEKYIEERFLNVKEVSELKQLTVHHLFGVFNILLIGLAIACISLIIEITISKVKVYNRAKKSIRKKGLKRDAK